MAHLEREFPSLAPSLTHPHPWQKKHDPRVTPDQGRGIGVRTWAISNNNDDGDNNDNSDDNSNNKIGTICGALSVLGIVLNI